MKVIHLSTYDSRAGAAKAAFRLHEGLKTAGVESHMVVRHKYLDDDSVKEAGGGLMRRIVREVSATFDYLPVRLYPHRNEVVWSTGWLFHDIASLVRRMRPDLVHLHWVGQGFVPMSAVPRFRVPLVWTLHDPWPLTGGCHYPNGCERFTTSCGRCPQLQSGRDSDVTRWIWKRKHHFWRQTHIATVAASQWMQQLAQSSSLFGSRTCEVIRYYLDPTVFKPLDRTAARRVFNLPDDRPIILMGAIRSTFDPRKGYRHLKEAADILGTLQWPEKPLVVVFGSPSGSADQALSLETRFFGRLDDDTSLALLYSAGDVTVVPSLEEAFGLTALESSACGTPVVAFDVGGLGDTVKHNQTGYLAKPLDTADLARGIRWVLEDDQRRRDLGNQARERVLQAFSARESLRRHLDLYTRLLATVQPR